MQLTDKGLIFESLQELHARLKSSGMRNFKKTLYRWNPNTKQDEYFNNFKHDIDYDEYVPDEQNFEYWKLTYFDGRSWQYPVQCPPYLNHDEQQEYSDNFLSSGNGTWLGCVSDNSREYISDERASIATQGNSIQIHYKDGKKRTLAQWQKEDDEDFIAYCTPKSERSEEQLTRASKITKTQILSGCHNAQISNKHLQSALAILVTYHDSITLSFDNKGRQARVDKIASELGNRHTSIDLPDDIWIAIEHLYRAGIYNEKATAWGTKEIAEDYYLMHDQTQNSKGKPKGELTTAIREILESDNFIKNAGIADILRQKTLIDYKDEWINADEIEIYTDKGYDTAITKKAFGDKVRRQRKALNITSPTHKK